MNRCFRDLPKIACAIAIATALWCCDRTPIDEASEVEGKVAMADGVELNVSVMMPGGPRPDGGWPALVFVHGLTGSKEEGKARRAAERGYVGMAYTVRGQGRREGGKPSDGYSGPTGVGLQETDLRDLIDWLKTEYPINPAAIGIQGNSQGGIHSWMAVARRLGVAAAAPWNFTARVGDALSHHDGIHSRLVTSPDAPIARPPGWNQERRRRVVEQDLAALLADAQAQDFRAGLAGKTIPVMAQIAFEDNWGIANNVVRDFDALEGPKKLYLGTGGHGSEVVESEEAFRQEWTERWFDRWLKDEANGIEDEPPVVVALLDTWRHLELEAFPPPDVEMHPYGLSGDRLIDRAANSGPVRTLRNALDAGFTIEEFYDAGAPENGPNGVLTRFHMDSLRYLSEPLAAPLLLVGIPTVKLDVATPAGDSQVAVRLWAVNPADNTRRLISRTSFTSRQAETTLEGELSATAYQVPAGRILEVELSNVDLNWNHHEQRWNRLWAMPIFRANQVRVRGGSITLPIYREVPR